MAKLLMPWSRNEPIPEGWEEVKGAYACCDYGFVNRLIRSKKEFKVRNAGDGIK